MAKEDVYVVLEVRQTEVGEKIHDDVSVTTPGWDVRVIGAYRNETTATAIVDARPEVRRIEKVQLGD